MNCRWDVMISWLLLQFLVPAQSYVRTRIINSYSNRSIYCDNDLKINITEVNIIRISRQCISRDDECSLTEDVAYMLKNDCDKKGSCTINIHNFTTKPLKCLTDFGYFNLTYSCETKVGSCNFDTDWCDWLTHASNSNRFRWERKKIDNYNKIPPRDHTTASANGRSAYIYSKHHDKTKKLNAQLYLGNILSSEEQCLSFWYYITDTNHVLKVFLNNQNIENLQKNSVDHWHQATIRIPGSTSQDSNTYRIVLHVISGESNTNGALAVDDIILSNRDCSDFLYGCNFETNTCYADYEPSIDMIEENDLTYSWIRHKCNRYTFTGPQTDHTTGSSVSGSCMYLDSIGGSMGDIAYTKTSSMKVNRKSCLTFWYHMFGEDMGRLNVTLNMNHIWSEYGDKGDKWNIATIDIDPQDNFSFQFVGIYGSGNACDIAIDDILLLPGSCSGLSDHKKVCVDLDDVPPETTYCPRGYLDFTNSSLTFEPEKTDFYCSEIYHQTKTRLRTDCLNRNDSQKCVIDLSTDKRSHPECFQLNELQILHTCEVINSREGDSPDVITVYAVVVSTLVIIIVAVLVFSVIVCYFKKRAKSSKLCDIRQHTSVREMIDSSGYNIINYNKMTGINISDIDKSKPEANTTNRQPQDISTAIKQEDTIGNTYESLSTNQNPSEHAYESDPIHSNQYQTLTKQRESDKHFYESTEPAQAQAQDNKTFTGQEDDICHKYESLLTNQNSVEHAYELDVLHINQYQILTKQRESDKHLYESTEPVQAKNIQTFIKQEDDVCNKYESLSTNRNPTEHAYASDQIHTNQYESLSKQRESDKHVYESTEPATKQEDDICNKYELLSTNRNPNEHAYETDSIHTNQYQTLTNQRESDKHFYESTEHALRVSMD